MISKEDVAEHCEREMDIYKGFKNVDNNSIGYKLYHEHRIVKDILEENEQLKKLLIEAVSDLDYAENCATCKGYVEFDYCNGCEYEWRNMELFKSIVDINKGE